MEFILLLIGAILIYGAAKFFNYKIDGKIDGKRDFGLICGSIYFFAFGSFVVSLPFLKWFGILPIK